MSKAADAYRVLIDAAAIARSGIVDSEYYRAQTGLPLRTDITVARHYLMSGARAGLSLHPLFESEFLPAGDIQGANPVLKYLTDSRLQEKSSPHPVFDLLAAGRQLDAQGATVTQGRWLSWLRTATPGRQVPVPPGAAAVTWGELRAQVIEAAVAWRSGTSVPGLDWQRDAAVPREPGLISIIVPLHGNLSSTLGRLALLRRDAPRELTFVGPASRAEFTCLSALSRIRAVTVVQDSARSLASLWNLGATRCRGDRLIFVAPWATLTVAAMLSIAEALDQPGTAIAQPLNEQPDMTIGSAGAYFPPDDVVPSALFESHPTGDVHGTEVTAIPAALSAVIAVRAKAFLELRGFDPALGNDFLETDLSLRCLAAGAGRTVLVPGARITVRDSGSLDFSQDPGLSAGLLRRRHQPTGLPSDLVRSAGFTVRDHHLVPLGGSAGGSRRGPELERLQSGVDASPHLRWTIDTPVTAGWWAEAWGDWHFAHSLARALGRLGQQVAVDTKSARHRSTRRFDDVLLTLRGMDRVEAPAAPVNLMWVIYNPEDVTAAECSTYDQVFGASHTWAAERSAEWGMPILPLLQCTDRELFHPERGLSAPSGQILFVGNARRGGSRPIVEAALAAGVPVDVYGTGWDAVPSADGRVVALRLPNADLGRLYAETGVVLNDHLEGMREAGFISNRLFDAVACGARVLSDPISGAEEIFGGSVQYCEPAEVGQRLAVDPDASWPSGAERRAVAAKVREEHSFDQRARVLLETAIAVLSGEDPVRAASIETSR